MFITQRYHVLTSANSWPPLEAAIVNANSLMICEFSFYMARSFQSNFLKLYFFHLSTCQKRWRWSQSRKDWMQEPRFYISFFWVCFWNPPKVEAAIVNSNLRAIFESQRWRWSQKREKIECRSLVLAETW